MNQVWLLDNLRMTIIMSKNHFNNRREFGAKIISPPNIDVYMPIDQIFKQKN